MPLILPGNVASAVAGAYEVANSCRFNDGDSAYMQKSASGGNRRTFTISAWVKRSATGGGVSGYNTFFSSDEDVENSFRLTFSGDASDDKIMTYFYTGSQQMQLITNREFRDFSAWYHVVVAVDTTQGTEANRTKLYVNGVQETSFSTENYPDQNQDMSVNQSGAPNRVGAGTSLFFDGYIAEFCLIDGLALAPTSFGEFNSDSPTIWQPIDVSGLTFGTNGFYLDFEASANLGNDANGGTDLTETNVAATDQSTDTPTNNGNVHNILIKSTPTLSEGNLNVTTSVDDTWETATGTIGVNSGKWYCEYKVITKGSSAMFGVISTTEVNAAATGKHIGYSGLNSLGYGYNHGGQKYNNNTDASYGDTYDADDIISIALDLDNNKLYFAKNGTWQDSGDPTSGATGTGAAYSLTAGYYYTFGASVHSSSDQMSANFGSPNYANSSDAADADGYGAFEYAPPSGYFALNTKNLAEYG